MGGDKGFREHMRKQLELKERELALIKEIDNVRDSAEDPSAMLSGIINALTGFLDAGIGVLCLVNRETDELELKALNDNGRLYAGLTADGVAALAAKALEAGGTQHWTTDTIKDMLKDAAVPDDFNIVASAIVLNDKKLGVLMLGRSGKQFHDDELTLLETGEDHVDSAVIQGYTYHELQQRNKELEVIYQIDHVRDQHLTFDDMLTRVLQEMQNVIKTEMSYIMLYDQNGDTLELRSATHDDLFQVGSYTAAVETAAREALASGELICHNEGQQGLRSIMSIPLILEDEVIGVLGMVNCYRPGGFNADDRRLLSAIASQMDTAIFETLEKRQLKEVLGRSVDPRVMQRILGRSDVSFLKGERAEVSVLYADIRGSTSLAERTDPDILVEFINDYLAAMTEIILAHEGTLDKFVGDEVMALFGAPFPQDDHAVRAVHVGLEMQNAHQAVLDKWLPRNLGNAPIGIGIATGDLIAGEMGCAQRTDYTVIGRAANLGARICSAAKGGQVLACSHTYSLIKDQVEAAPVTGLDLKGIGENMTVYHVTSAPEP